MKPYYQDSQVTLYHGDCRDVAPALGRFDLLLTDPPYGLGEKWQGGKAKWPLHHGQMGWDADPSDALLLMVDLATDAVVWGGHLYPLPPRRGWLIWDKIVREFTSGHCEMAWSTLDQPIRAKSISHGQLATEGKFHPTQKPLDLMLWCLGFFPAAATVFDPFMGSGTALVAAKNLNRRGVGIEREERYCEIAATRLSQNVLDLGGVA